MFWFHSKQHFIAVILPPGRYGAGNVLQNFCSLWQAIKFLFTPVLATVH